MAPPSVGGGGSAVAREVVTPLVETSHVDSLCNVLCFADGFKETLLTQETLKICSINPTESANSTPIFLTVFETLLSGVYTSYITNIQGTYMAKGQMMHANMGSLLQSLQESEGLMIKASKIKGELNAIITTYNDNIRTYGTTTANDRELFNKATKSFFETTQAELVVTNKISAIRARISELEKDMIEHSKGIPSIQEKIRSIEDLKSKKEKRSRYVIYMQEKNKRGSVSPLGDLPLEEEEEQIQECKALKFLSAMFIRYCYIQDVSSVNTRRASKVRPYRLYKSLTKGLKGNAKPMSKMSSKTRRRLRESKTRKALSNMRKKKQKVQQQYNMDVKKGKEEEERMTE